MALKELVFRDWKDLQGHIQSGVPTFYFASQTSTVIPYDRIAVLFERNGHEHLALGNLSLLPKRMDLDQQSGNLFIEGPISWHEARQYCSSQGSEILTSPTEELACVLSGLATSATGERCFGFGSLRDQVLRCSYYDYQGRLKELSSKSKLPQSETITAYDQAYSDWESFKNAPFPRLRYETDLMIGTEGQLGVIRSATLNTRKATEIIYIFILLPKWEEDDSLHLKIHQYVQNLRSKIFSCELLDDNSLNALPPADRPGVVGEDLIFLEIEMDSMEEILDGLLKAVPELDGEKIFEISATKCRQLRMGIPRATFEMNSRMGVVKMGTDVQVTAEKMGELLEFYRRWTSLGIGYNLFGHFGDSHLHFNFLPVKEQLDRCETEFGKLYDQVVDWKGSPFAEHGVGVIKKKYIRKFYGEVQYRMFRELKRAMDPKNQFFPMGFMNEGDFLA